MGGAILTTASPVLAAALPPCKPLADNCRSSNGGGDLPPFPIWKPGKRATEAWADIVSAIEAYPQKGQGSIDGGGWKIADRIEGSYIRVEYTSKIFRFIPHCIACFCRQLKVVIRVDL